MLPLKVKFVVNKCFGGFSLSQKAALKMRELGSEAAKKFVIKGEKDEDGYINNFDNVYVPHSFSRADPILVQVVEELGEEANGTCSKLRVVTAYFDITYEDHDGMETPGTYGWIENE